MIWMSQAIDSRSIDWIWWYSIGWTPYIFPPVTEAIGSVPTQKNNNLGTSAYITVYHYWGHSWGGYSWDWPSRDCITGKPDRVLILGVAHLYAESRLDQVDIVYEISISGLTGSNFTINHNRLRSGYDHHPQSSSNQTSVANIWSTTLYFEMPVKSTTGHFWHHIFWEFSVAHPRTMGGMGTAWHGGHQHIYYDCHGPIIPRGELTNK